MLHPNSQRLVDELEALSLLDGRYRDIRLVNVQAGVQRGHFSLVFKAFDAIEAKHVALKFLDPDPSKFDPFRWQCFEREQTILSGLIGASRCLQVLSPVQVFELQISSAGTHFTVPIRYFVTEWCEHDIDAFFLRQDPTQAQAKLHVFNEVVLAVQALHAREIIHRDLKVDNFRRRGGSIANDVVAIDLGTAARELSKPILGSYPGPVGHLYYSAPEAFCGMAGNHKIAFQTDIYALGCMLFELFAEDDFWTAFISINSDFETRLNALQYSLASHMNSPNLLTQWDLNAPRLLAGLSPLQLPRDGSSAPLAIIDTINELIRALTVPNFRFRSIGLDVIRKRIWSMIRCLENERFAQRKADAVANNRRHKQELARRKQARALANQDSNGVDHGRA